MLLLLYVRSKMKHFHFSSEMNLISFAHFGGDYSVCFISVEEKTHWPQNSNSCTDFHDCSSHVSKATMDMSLKLYESWFPSL